MVDKLWLFLDILLMIFIISLILIYMRSVYQRVRVAPKVEKPESKPIIIEEMSKN